MNFLMSSLYVAFFMNSLSFSILLQTFFYEFLLFLNSTKKFSGEFPFCCIFLWILLQRFLLKSPLSVAGDSLSFFYEFPFFFYCKLFLMSSHSVAFCLWICYAILLQIFLIDFHVAGYSWAFWRRSDPCFCSTEEACNVSSKFPKPFNLISIFKLPLTGQNGSLTLATLAVWSSGRLKPPSPDTPICLASKRQTLFHSHQTPDILCQTVGLLTPS